MWYSKKTGPTWWPHSTRQRWQRTPCCPPPALPGSAALSSEWPWVMTPGPPKYIHHYMGVAWSVLRSAEDQREHVLVHGGVDGLERSLEFATECGGPAGTCTCPWWSRWTRATECGGPAGTCTCLWWSRWTRATRRSPPPSPTGNLEMLLSDWTWTLNFEHIKDSFKYDVNQEVKRRNWNSRYQVNLYLNSNK